MQFEEIHNTELFPFEIEGYEIALKNFVLYTHVDGECMVGVSQKHVAVAFDFLSKQNEEYDVLFLDEISFDKLYNLFIDIKADREMIQIQQEQEEATVDDEEFSVAEFLKVGSDILTSEESAPIIKFVNSLFYQAIKKKASDIHVEIHEYKGEIRYRIDGVLSKHIELDKNIMTLVVSRIKVISNLDISERRVPQDGRTQIKIAGKTLDVRVSVLPTFYGERVVMRILMQSDDILHLEDLGFSSAINTQLESVVEHSYGMVLVTGPTGSGKSTTLHSLLQKIVSPEKNIITIEDPVEYKSDNISQIQVNNQVGLSFSSGLRSILRQDPDIIMLGEIRDEETASIAVQSALTGHLLFSTLHTNRAPAAVTRLIDMGVEKFLISSSLLAVLAQRLVRRLCPSCKEEDNREDFIFLTDKKHFKSVGCKECNYTGYKGRVAIGELFVIDDKIKMLLKEDVDDTSLMQVAIDNGMIPLKDQLEEMFVKGETSLDEVLRIGIK